jgi:hemerythrin-like domain-containing protein
MRTATDILRDEHHVILDWVGRLEVAAARLEGGDTLPDERWTELVDWLRAFADDRHHAKEENLLFPAMIRAGIPPRGGPVDVMLEDHEECRALMATMAAGPRAERTAAARRYVRLLREHIAKENEVVFPLADAVLDADAQAALLQGFVQADATLGAVTTR